MKRCPRLFYLRGPRLFYLRGPRLFYLRGPRLFYLRGPRLFYLRSPSLIPTLVNRVYYTIINEAEDDDGNFKFLQFTILYLKKINHDIETNLMSDNTLFFQLIYLTPCMEGYKKHRNQCYCRLIGLIILKWSAREITEGLWQHV
jgi:hypothetical protein